MKLNITNCVDGLPETSGNYCESGDLLFCTVHGRKIVGRFRKSELGPSYFYPETESRPYRVDQIVWWAGIGHLGLERNKENMPELSEK